MGKRFTDTELWEQDWFLDMPNEYKLFYFYVKDNCDHAGIFKVNLRSFCLLNKVEIDTKKALKFFNKDKQRMQVLSDSKWFLIDFFVYQYGTTFNINNRVHKSVQAALNTNNLTLTSIRGLKEVVDRVKDKDKGKDIDKEQDEDKDEDNNKELTPENFTSFNDVVLLFDKKNYNEKSWLECYDKLIRLDEYSEDRILAIVKEFRSDGNWWHDNGNFESLLKLRNKNKDGVKFIDIFDKQLSSGNRGDMNAGEDYEGGFKN